MALNHLLSTTTALAFGGPFFHFQGLQFPFTSLRLADVHAGENEPWQRGAYYYLQGPLLKNAYISYSGLETWHSGEDEVSCICRPYLCSAFRNVGWDSSYIPRVKMNNVFASRNKDTVWFFNLRKYSFPDHHFYIQNGRQWHWPRERLSLSIWPFSGLRDLCQLQKECE